MHLPFQITWYYNEKVIEQTDRTVIKITQDVHMYHVILTIDEVTKEDAGKYRVVAKNTEGEASVQVSLIVRGT